MEARVGFYRSWHPEQGRSEISLLHLQRTKMFLWCLNPPCEGAKFTPKNPRSKTVFKCSHAQIEGAKLFFKCSHPQIEGAKFSSIGAKLRELFLVGILNSLIS